MRTRVRDSRCRAVLAFLALLALGLTGPVAARAAPGNVYVANRSTGDLSAFALAADGAPSLLGAPVKAGGFWPVGVAVTPDGRHAYVTDDTNALSRFDIAPDGTLTQVGTPVNTGGTNPLAVAITPDGRHAYVADNGTSDLSRFDIAPDGTLTQVGTPVNTGGSRPTGVAITPDGRHAYVADWSSSDLSRFDIASDGTLTQVGTPVKTGGTNPLGVAITPGGRHAYVVDDISRDLSRFDIASDGALTRVGTPVNTGGVDPADVAVTPDGRHAYVTDNGSGDLSRFDIASDGTLKHVGMPVNTGGVGPEGVAVTPDGRHAYVPNDDTSDLSRFDIAPDGSLTQVGTPVATGGVNPGDYFTVAVRPDQGPVAAFVPTVAPAGRRSSFDASGSSDADGQVVRYDWSLGDGTMLTNAGPTVSHTYGTAGAYNVSVTVTDDAGCSSAQVFTGQTVGCNGSPAARRTTTITVPAPTLAPAASINHIARLNLAPATFTAAATGPPVVTARRAKTGTLVSYRGTQPAATTFTVKLLAAGRRSGRSCVKPTKGNSKHKPCTLYPIVGSFTHADTAGTNQFRLSGRFNGRKLRPGHYLLQANPRNTAGPGPAHYAQFQIKP